VEVLCIFETIMLHKKVDNSANDDLSASCQLCQLLKRHALTKIENEIEYHDVYYREV
jgi:hypothetical protein